VSKSLFKIWKVATIAMLTAVAIAFSIRPRYGWYVILSCTNAELFIGAWRKAGASYAQALAIAGICSNYDLLSYFVLFGWLRSVRREEIRIPWRSKLYGALRRIGKALGHFCVPEPRNGPDTRWHYLPLPLYGAWPGCIVIGANYSLNFKLRQGRAFLLMVAGNFFVKMVFFAWITVSISPYLAIGVLIVFSHLMKRMIERFFRKLASWSAKKSMAAPPAVFIPEFDEGWLP